MTRVEQIKWIAEAELPLTEEQQAWSLYVHTEYENVHECKCERKELRKRTLSNGGQAAYEQCINCGKSQSRKTPPDGLGSLPSFDDELANITQHLWAAKKKYMVNELDRAKQVEKDAWWVWYNEYLRTPEWLHKRMLVIRRCNGICEGCGEKKVALVHHTTYANVGDELLYQLVGLCYQCHKKAHKETQ